MNEMAALIKKNFHKVNILQIKIVKYHYFLVECTYLSNSKIIVFHE